MADKTPPPKSGTVATGVGIAMLLTVAFEGLVTHPNPDPGKPEISQVCYGDTEVPMRTYTPAECKSMLQARQERDYAPQVLKCVPGLADPKRVKVFAASIDASYNAGVAAFCKSPMARRFNAGDWAGGCAAFITLGKDGKPVAGWYYGSVSRSPVKGAWYSYRIKTGPNAGKYYNVFRGLVRRRVAERNLCVVGAN